MAPVAGIVHASDVDHGDDGRAEVGPYDIYVFVQEEKNFL